MSSLFSRLAESRLIERTVDNVQDLDPVVLFESGCHQSESLVSDVRTSSQSSCAPVNCHFTRGMSDHW